MLIYSHIITPRLQYVTTYIAGEFGLSAPILTADMDDYKSYQGLRIHYGTTRLTESEILICPQGLLFEQGIRQQPVKIFSYKEYPTFFSTDGDYPFDIFSSIFFLLSRYEEYLPYEADIYGRYPHTDSLAYNNNFLHLPLINIWLEDFKGMLTQKSNDSLPAKKSFTIIPTYDIDMAWSYLHKGFSRNLANILKSLLRFDFGNARSRIAVLLQREKDPMDVYHWLDDLHHTTPFYPVYFFLLAQQRGRYDKNISHKKTAMQQLVKTHAAKYSVGIHPSWQSGTRTGLLEKEIETLQNITGQFVEKSRQHFIRFTLPGGYRRLINAGITEDYSMGYGNCNGFRASVASPFYWYDLEQEKMTTLLCNPFCFMDSTAFFEDHLTPQQVLAELQQFTDCIKSVNGTMITIWHNSILGADEMFIGWKEMYRQWLIDNAIT